RPHRLVRPVISLVHSTSTTVSTLVTWTTPTASAEAASSAGSSRGAAGMALTLGAVRSAPIGGLDEETSLSARVRPAVSAKRPSITPRTGMVRFRITPLVVMNGVHLIEISVSSVDLRASVGVHQSRIAAGVVVEAQGVTELVFAHPGPIGAVVGVEDDFAQVLALLSVSVRPLASALLTYRERLGNRNCL